MRVVCPVTRRNLKKLVGETGGGGRGGEGRGGEGRGGEGRGGEGRGGEGRGGEGRGGEGRGGEVEQGRKGSVKEGGGGSRRKEAHGGRGWRYTPPLPDGGIVEASFTCTLVRSYTHSTCSRDRLLQESSCSLPRTLPSLLLPSFCWASLMNASVLSNSRRQVSSWDRWYPRKVTSFPSTVGGTSPLFSA